MKLESRTMFVGVFGSFEPHPGLTAAEDAYRVFAARSAAMEWSSTGAPRQTADLWGMNDAACDSAASGAGDRIAWFQVGLPDSVPVDVLLPIKPLLACAGESLTRVGRLQFAALQLFVPLEPVGVERALSLDDLNWFTAVEHPNSVQIRVTCDGGEDDSVADRASAVLAWLQRLKIGPFSVEAVVVGDADAVILEPPVVGPMWMGEGHHRVTFQGRVPEWSIDALAFIVSLLVEGYRRQGLRTSVLISLRSA